MLNLTSAALKVFLALDPCDMRKSFNSLHTLSEWKKTMAEGAAGIFGPGSGKTEAEDFERERAQLHAKIGQQAVELDWLTKKSKQLGL